MHNNLQKIMLGFAISILSLLMLMPVVAQQGIDTLPSPRSNDGRLREWGTNGAVYADENGIYVFTTDEQGNTIPLAGVSAGVIENLPTDITENRLLAINPELTVAIFQLADGGFEVKVGPDPEGTVRAVSFDAIPPTFVYHYEERNSGGFNITFPITAPQFASTIEDLEAGPDAETEAMMDEPASEAESIADLSMGVPLDEPLPTQPAIVIEVPNVDAPIVITATPLPENDTRRRGYLIVNTDNLNIRTGTSPEYTVQVTVDGGTELDVLGRTEDFSYWFVSYQGIRGWVPAEFVLIRGDLTGAPVVVTEGEIIQPTWINGAEGNPIFPYLPHEGIPVCTLPGNTEFRIVGRSGGGNWYQILANCGGEPTIGWVEQELGLTRNPAEVVIPITYR